MKIFIPILFTGFCSKPLPAKYFKYSKVTSSIPNQKSKVTLKKSDQKTFLGFYSKDVFDLKYRLKA